MAAFNAREVKRAAAEESEREREKTIPLQKDSEGQRKRQSHPKKLLENCRKEAICGGGRLEKERQLAELGDDQSPSNKASARSRRRRSKGDVRRGAIEKGRSVSSIKEKEVRGDERIGNFLPRGSEVPFESHRG